MLRPSLVLATVVLVSSPARAGAVTSTPAGGPWHDGATWIGGAPPGAGDSAVIQGPVTVSGDTACLSLELTPDGTLANGSIFPVSLAVATSITNAGTITGGMQSFTLSAGGDVTNTGHWASHETHLTGAADRHLVAGSGSSFESDLVMDGTGDVLVDTPFAILGDVDMGEGRMILGADSPLTLRAGRFEGGLLCNGNEVRVESWSYFTQATIDAAVLVGEVEVTHGVAFTGGLTVMDVLQNSPTFGSAHVTIAGGLVNEGVIRNNTYGLTIALSGDIVCNGAITCSHVTLDGLADHHVSTGPSGQIGTVLFLPEFGAGTIVADDDLSVSGGLVLGAGGTLILTPGASLALVSQGTVRGGTLLANGNAISMNGTGQLDALTVDGAVIRDTVQVGPGCAFTGGLTVEGALRSWPFIDPDVTVEGTFRNTGLVTDGQRPLTVRAHGDVVNEGEWRNARLVVMGSDDQTVAIGPGLDVPDVRLEAGITASAYQWYRDGVAIPGETSATLVFDTLAAGDTGIYHCEGDGQLSRTIDVTADPVVDVPGGPEPSAPLAALEPVRPNPFFRSTAVGFAVAAAGPVRLAAFDVSGRRVATLIDARVSAGRHVVTWRAGEAPAGVYFLELRAGSERLVRKVTRLE